LIYYPQKKNKITTVNVLLLLFLRLFFSSTSLVFVDRGRKNISCPRAQGTLDTPLLRPLPKKDLTMPVTKLKINNLQITGEKWKICSITIYYLLFHHLFSVGLHLKQHGKVG